MDSKKYEPITNYKEKIEMMENVLAKDIFSNPLREVQIKHRRELLEYKEILENDMLNLEKHLVYEKFNFLI